MKILILGGTVFLGRHLAAAALARGHRLTLFNRGRSHPRLFAGVEELHGDRRRDLGALRGRTWDAAVDTCGYTPGTVGAAAELLAASVDHFTFISSVSAYAGFAAEGIDEDAPVGSLDSEEIAEGEEIARRGGASARRFGRLYGPLKALSEAAAERALPGRVLRVRPGLIVGPWDYSGRFTYWVRRTARGGEVLAPDRPQRPIRVIDARDLAEWIVRRIEAGEVGVWNATGADGVTMGQLLDNCRVAAGGGARLTWVAEDLLLAEEVGPWIELPLWLPEEHNGIFAVKNDRAVAAGLRFRPLAETVGDTLAWDRATDSAVSWEDVGLTPERERQLLDRHRRRAAAAPSGCGPRLV